VADALFHSLDVLRVLTDEQGVFVDFALLVAELEACSDIVPTKT